jgi:hypothetical protein
LRCHEILPPEKVYGILKKCRSADALSLLGDETDETQGLLSATGEKELKS